MRKLAFVSLLFVVAVGLPAQEAHVIALKSEDAAHAKCAWERLQKAQKEWEQVQEDIRKDYLLAPVKDNVITGGDFRTYKKGFESGFQFSEDFKYIVPKPYQNTTSSGNLLWNLGGSCWCLDGYGSGHACPCTGIAY